MVSGSTRKWVNLKKYSNPKKPKIYSTVAEKILTQQLSNERNPLQTPNRGWVKLRVIGIIECFIGLY